MLEGARIGLKVDVDTLRGTRDGVPRLAALLKKHGVDATFYFSVGPDHTGRALRRIFRKGFAQKVARTSVLKHYGVKTLLYGVVLPGPDIARLGGAAMRAVHDLGFEVGVHTFDHVRWQDHVSGASPEWTRVEFERALAAFAGVFGFLPASHAAAGWQINETVLALEHEHGLRYASDTRGDRAFYPLIAGRASPCMQIPTTLPTFDELLGVDGVDEGRLAETVFQRSVAAQAARSASAAIAAAAAAAPAAPPMQVYTLHAELEGLRLLDAFEALLVRWRRAGAALSRMAALRDCAAATPLPTCRVARGMVPGRSGLLAVGT